MVTSLILHDFVSETMADKMEMRLLLTEEQTGMTRTFFGHNDLDEIPVGERELSEDVSETSEFDNL